MACDSGSFTPGSPIPPGPRTFKVFATDTSNNTDLSPASYGPWTIDIQPPVISYAPLGATNNVGNVHLNTTVTDNVGVASGTVSVNPLPSLVIASRRVPNSTGRFSRFANRAGTLSFPSTT